MNIAIIEDKLNRLEQFTQFDLKKYNSVKIITGSEFDNIIDCLRNNNTKPLDKFDCIASHRSALSNEERDSLKEYCKINRKSLIFFSGSITSNVLKDVEFPFLLINSREFYSENLKKFIEDCEENNVINLLVLQFGENWKLSLLLNLRNNISVALNKQVLKTQFPSIELDERELIRRVRDLQINNRIKTELINEKTKAILTDNDLTIISHDQVKVIKDVLDRLINEII